MGSLRLQILAALSAVACVWGGIFPGANRGLAQVVDPEIHPWTRFAPGSWKTMRTTSETFEGDQQRLSHSVTHTRSELISRDEHSYTLRLTSEVVVMGKRLTGRRHTLRRRYEDVPFAYHVSYQQQGTKTVRLNGRTFDCKVYQGKASGPEGTLQVTLWICADRFPHVLYRRLVLTGPKSQVLEETTWETLAVEMPFQVLQQLVPTTHYKVVQRKPSGTIVRLVVASDQVPGGVVFESSKELDPQGRLRRRSTQELVAYGIFRAAVSERGRNYYGYTERYRVPRTSPRHHRRGRRWWGGPTRLTPIHLPQP